MKNVALSVLAIIVSITFISCASHKEASKNESKDPAGTITTASGLKYIDIDPGQGPIAKEGQTMVIHYVGTFENGDKFDSSRDRNTPIEYKAFTKGFIPGWVEGASPMRVGGKRKLIIPPSLAYGDKGSGTAIPPNATLIFDIEVLEIK
jgi:peptidylprolyl isomerase